MRNQYGVCICTESDLHIGVKYNPSLLPRYVTIEVQLQVVCIVVSLIPWEGPGPE